MNKFLYPIYFDNLFFEEKITFLRFFWGPQRHCFLKTRNKNLFIKNKDNEFALQPGAIFNTSFDVF